MSTDPKAVGTYLMVLPTKTRAFRGYFSAVRSQTACQADDAANKFNAGKFEGIFATKLLAYTRLHPTDMQFICKLGVELTSVLQQAFYAVYGRFISFKRAGGPFSSRNISLSKIISEFNAHVQLGFFFIIEIDKHPILNITDTHSA